MIKYMTSKDIFTLENNIVLDDNQRKCILDDSKATLLIAGAGSGKTTTIQGKIKYLVLVKKINPEEILCISFTRKTAYELKEKLLQIDKKIDVSTFHSLGLKIIKRLSNKNYKVASPTLLLDITRNILKKQKINNLIYEKQVLSLLNMIMSNNYPIENLKKVIEKEKNIFLKKFYTITYLCFQTYHDKLKKDNLIDYNDMIVKATNLLKNKYYKKYQYIIIDEYQDISYIRYQLIKELINQTEAKLLVVGDDYQSIYSFTGSRIDLFINFKKYFLDSNILYLTNTYRNSQQLLNYTTDFILKNKNHIKKNLCSIKQDEKPIVFIKYLSLSLSLKKLLPKLTGSILILGRNNQDIDLLKDKDIIIKNKVIKYKKYQAKFLTVHQAKGLESDNVILINMKNELLGFPNQIKEPFYINLFPNLKENYPYAEERRLFYVALTRTKNKVYIMEPLNKKSIFVKELKKLIKTNY